MEDDNYSIDSILSENQVLVFSSPRPARYKRLFTQKIQRTFAPSRWATIQVAASATYEFTEHPLPHASHPTLVLGQSSEQSSSPTPASLHSHIFVREDKTRSARAFTLNL
jgi:hypothetical protein